MAAPFRVIAATADEEFGSRVAFLVDLLLDVGCLHKMSSLIHKDVGYRVPNGTPIPRSAFRELVTLIENDGNDLLVTEWHRNRFGLGECEIDHLVDHGQRAIGASGIPRQPGERLDSREFTAEQAASIWVHSTIIHGRQGQEIVNHAVCLSGGGRLPEEATATLNPLALDCGTG